MLFDIAFFLRRISFVGQYLNANKIQNVLSAKVEAEIVKTHNEYVLPSFCMLRKSAALKWRVRLSAEWNKKTNL